MKKDITKSATVISILLTWFIKDSITPLLFAGKRFDGRSLMIQIFLIIIYFLLFAYLLKTIFPKQMNWFSDKYQLLILFIYCLPMITHIILGTFSRFYADDYCSAAKANSLGILKATSYWYTKWSGRFSAHLYDAIMGYLGPHASPFSTLFILIIWIIVLSKTIFSIIKCEKSRNMITALFFAVIIIYTTLEITPDVSQSLYWGQGMRSVIPPLILGTLIINLYNTKLTPQYLHNNSQNKNLVLVGILILIAGGFSETYSAFQVYLFTSLLLLSLSKEFKRTNKTTSYILFGLVVSIISMVILILAPGNKYRQLLTPPPNSVFKIIEISVKSMISYLDNLFRNPINLWNIIGFLLTSTITSTGLIFKIRNFNNGMQFRKYLKYFTLTIFITLISLYICFLPSAYGLSNAPPNRTLIIPTYILVCSLALLGYLSGQLMRFHLLKSHKNHNRIIVLGFLFSLFLTSFSINAIESTKRNVNLIPEYKIAAEQWDQIDQMILKNRNEGQLLISVPIIEHPSGFQGIGSVDWINTCASEYYQVSELDGYVLQNKSRK